MATAPQEREKETPLTPLRKGIKEGDKVGLSLNGRDIQARVFRVRDDGTLDLMFGSGNYQNKLQNVKRGLVYLLDSDGDGASVNSARSVPTASRMMTPRLSPAAQRLMFM